MIKMIEDNKELLKQNEELKNMNEVILSNMKELPNLEQKYTDLFETVKLLQEENHLLKEASKYSSLIELSQNKINDIQNDNNIDNIDSTKNKKTKNLLLDDEGDDDEESKETGGSAAAWAAGTTDSRCSRWRPPPGRAGSPPADSRPCRPRTSAPGP